MGVASLSSADRKLLDDYARAWVKLANLAALSDEELKRLDQAARRTSRTNCGWDTYGAAQFLRKSIDAERVDRTRMAELRGVAPVLPTEETE